MTKGLLTVNDSNIEYARSLLNRFECIDETGETGRTEQDQSSHEPKSEVVRCAGKPLMENPDWVYNFSLENHNAYAPKQRSFNEVVSAWERAENGIKGNRYTYSEVLRPDELASCTLRCTCRTCSESEAVEPECEAYPFGIRKGLMHEILVHKFKYQHDDDMGDDEGEPRAVLLGVSDNGRYRLWGPCYQGSLATTYYDWITLEEVFSTEVATLSDTQGAGKKHSAPEGTDESGGREPQKHNKVSAVEQRVSSVRPVASEARYSQLNDRDLRMNSNTVNGEGQMSRPGLRAGNNPADRSLTGHHGYTASDQRHATPNHLASFGGSARANFTPRQSTGNIQQSSLADLQKANDNAEAHVADQEDSIDLPVILTNTDLMKRLKNLKSAADRNNLAAFKIMWNSVNRDLVNAGLTMLPSP